MKAIRTWLMALWAWVNGPFDRPYRLVMVEGRFPAHIDSKRLYVLTEDGVPWEARMICPCGCKAALDLNLLPDDPPTWRFEADEKKRATLHPSVWRKIDCKSHFILRNGRIQWC
jgi:hypothetical protein